MEHGCRETRIQILTWPAFQPTSGFRIGVSQLDFFENRFISGLRILLSNVEHEPSLETMAGRSKAGMMAGIIQPLRETSIPCFAGESLCAIDVSVFSRGIAGLRFHFTKGSSADARSTEWIGQASPSNRGHTLGRLQPSSSGNPLEIAVGLDACKLTSIALVEKSHSTFPSSAVAPPFVLRYNQARKLWPPKLMKLDGDKFMLLGRISYPHVKLRVDMVWAGSDRSHLQKFRGFVMQDNRYGWELFGVTYAYAGGPNKSWGKNGSSPTTGFFVDGPGGELITEVVLAHVEPYKGALAIILAGVATNWARVKSFVCKHREYRIQPKGYVAIAAKGGGTLTGFVAEWNEERQCFDALHPQARLPEGSEGMSSGFNIRSWTPTIDKQASSECRCLQ